ncbi:MAG: hypothetical protein K2X47_15245 [Bdellovibrionales bacterium]|nr:hypothetical protein [Bdellovibrionales bacterium]
MHFLEEIPAEHFGLGIIITGVIFGIFWFLDHRTHLRIWEKDITDGELRSHRMILYASYCLMGSLFLMAWYPWQALPLFIGCWITRTVHEFIDEIHWHLPRCTERETLIHLIMWISIHTATAIAFSWGFFLQYRGLGDLPFWMHASFIAIFCVYSYIGHRELMDYKTRRP